MPEPYQFGWIDPRAPWLRQGFVKPHLYKLASGRWICLLHGAGCEWEWLGNGPTPSQAYEALGKLVKPNFRYIETQASA